MVKLSSFLFQKVANLTMPVFEAFGKNKKGYKLMMQWTFDPHSGGNKISEARKRDVKRRIESYAKKYFQEKCERVEVTFRSQLCYIYAIEINEETKQEMKTPMCRLRHFDLEKWSISLFTWSNEKYEPAMFPKGEWFGSVEDATELGSTFL